MKYALSILIILLTSVTFTYYLLNNPNFLPVNSIGEYNWINIFTLIFLISLILFSLLNSLIYLILSFFNKGERKKEGKGERKEGSNEEITGYLSKEERKEEFYKKEKFNKKEKIILSVKFSFLITIGLLAVFSLNFFHILNWIWGVSILIVVLIFTFII
jgi:hypothetical protein